MRYRCNIFNYAHFKAGRLQGADSGLPAGTGPFNIALDFFHAVFHRRTSCLLRRLLSRKWSAFTRALETDGSRTGPGNRITFPVSNGNYRIVECRLDMSNAVVDIFSFPSLDPACSSSTRHLSLAPPLLLPLGCHDAARTFAGPGIGFCALPAYRKPAAVP